MAKVGNKDKRLAAILRIALIILSTSGERQNVDAFAGFVGNLGVFFFAILQMLW